MAEEQGEMVRKDVREGENDEVPKRPLSDSDLSRLGSLALGKGEVQHAILEAGVNLVAVHIVGERNGARVGAEAALLVAHIVAVVVLRELALGREGDSVVAGVDLDIFLPDAGKFDMDVPALISLIYVHCGVNKVQGGELAVAT